LRAALTLGRDDPYPRAVRFSGKVVLVTGAASGIGRAVAEAAAREHASVVLVDINKDALDAAAAGLPDALPLVGDLSDSQQVDAVFARAVRRFGVIDAVVHAAGIVDEEARARRNASLASGEPMNITLEMTDERWRRILAVDLDATFFVVRAALRAMVPRRSGSIVTIASIAGIEGGPGHTNYAAAKAGVLAITRSVGREVARQGVRINSIAPGPVDTGLRHRQSISPAKAVMGRLARPDEVAAAALFLASNESSYITGETLVVAGGLVTS
jgi:NAD(P)-dependent dehydrogenase (short-subunit alcohol dehydrogenase family)